MTRRKRGLPPGLPQPDTYPEPPPPKKASEDNPFICLRGKLCPRCGNTGHETVGEVCRDCKGASAAVQNRAANFRRVYVKRVAGGFAVAETSGSREIMVSTKPCKSLKRAMVKADKQVGLAFVMLRGKDQL